MINTTRATRACRLQLLANIRAVVVLSLLVITARAGADPLPNLGGCSTLQVEEGNKLVSHVYAEGVQIYRWDGTTWAFVGPEAKLFANPGNSGLVGTHYAGPTWESVSGSKVVGQLVQPCTADPNAIPWLLLRAVHDEGPGIFEGVSFIQRLNTVGGKAPVQPGDFPGQVARVDYTAEYFFYRRP